MVFTSVVFYQDSLAYYRVFEINANTFVANLYRYGGDPASSPPQAVILSKEGSKWRSNVSDQDLVDNIGIAIETTGE